jgi:hypothetical protein
MYCLIFYENRYVTFIVIYGDINDDLKPWHEHSLPLELIQVHHLCTK